MLTHAAALEELAQLREKVAAQVTEILSLKAVRVPKVWVDYAANVKPAVLDTAQVCRREAILWAMARQQNVHDLSLLRMHFVGMRYTAQPCAPP